MSEVTRLLDAAVAGDRRAAADLLPLVYDELRRLAAVQMHNEAPGHTLGPTALVHEAYLRLVGAGKNSGPSLAGAADSEIRFANRRHFFAAAAEAMRRILIDQARRKRSRKRGGELVRHDVEALDLALPEPREDLVALDEALQKLAQADPQAAELVQLRFFAGFALVDAAEVLGVSPRTAHRLWAYARAFLHREMHD
jgi:RNA polymerase sigma factor (TIGR02999 family)